MQTFDTPLGPFVCYDAGTIPRALAEGKWWDDHLKPLIDQADPQGVAIDIGAHIGWFTVYLAQRHDQVIACEPWPATFALLTQNVGLDRTAARGIGTWPVRQPEARIQCWPVAAYAEVTELCFAPQNDLTDPGAWGFIPPGYPDAVGAIVGIALDPYILPSDHVTLIKVDAQGADLKALQGLQQTIRRCRPLILFEWEAGMAGWQGDTWEDYLRFFREVGYQAPERITTDYWDFVARPR